MLISIIKTLSKTPWWVFAVFGYLIYLGIKSTKKRTISIIKLTIIAITFFIFSVKGLDSLWDITDFVAYIWLVAILVGIFFGWLSFIGKEVIIDKKAGLVQIPGSYNILLIFMTVFISRYVIGYFDALNLEFIVNPYMIFFKIFVSSLPPGILLGRLLFIFKNYIYGPYGELNKTKSGII